MKAQLGDYIVVDYDGAVAKVVEVQTDGSDRDVYITSVGVRVSERELGVDDIYLASEIEIG